MKYLEIDSKIIKNKNKINIVILNIVVVICSLYL